MPTTVTVRERLSLTWNVTWLPTLTFFANIVAAAGLSTASFEPDENGSLDLNDLSAKNSRVVAVALSQATV